MYLYLDCTPIVDFYNDADTLPDEKYCNHRSDNNVFSYLEKPKMRLNGERPHTCNNCVAICITLYLIDAFMTYMRVK